LPLAGLSPPRSLPSFPTSSHQNRRPAMRAIFAVVAFAAALTAGAYSVAPHEPKPAPAIAVAKIMTKTGHGSGTNIGGGFLTTAAHVVGKEDEVTVRLSDGREVKGEVLWANTRYDLALVRVAETPNFASANL